MREMQLNKFEDLSVCPGSSHFSLIRRIRPNLEAAPWVVDAVAQLEDERDTAIGLLRTLLNERRTGSELRAAEQRARSWIDSLGH